MLVKNYYLLDPSVTFLNHGSFGATPKPVFEIYQRWQLELERQPVEFIGRRVPGLLEEARMPLAQYFGTTANRLAFIVNTTYGMNVVTNSLNLKPGDEVLTTNHEYGAVDRTWKLWVKRHGFKYVQREMPVPMTTEDAFVEHFWAGVTKNTKVISLSHITSATATIFPISEIIRRARASDIITVIDGAHAPSQIPIQLDALGADFYIGNLHKWLSAPKGAAFIYARPEMDALIQPAIVSWGYDPDTPSNTPLQSYVEVQGTREFAAFLSVPDAIRFQQSHDWGTVRMQCHQLVQQARQRIVAMFEEEPLTPDSPDWYMQMCSIPLPTGTDALKLKQQLYDDFKVEIPIISWQGRTFARISIQAYNTQKDVDTLVSALKTILM